MCDFCEEALHNELLTIKGQRDEYQHAVSLLESENDRLRFEIDNWMATAEGWKAEFERMRDRCEELGNRKG